MSTTLYQSDLSPFAGRVRIQIRAKGLTGIAVEKAPGGTGSDEFKRINPTGKIPVLMVDGVAIAESQTICDYLEDRYPTPSLWPDDLLARAQARLITRATDLYVCAPMFQTTAHASKKVRDQAFVDARLAELKKGLETIDQYRANSSLATGIYAIGSRLTLADAALAPTLFFVANFAATVFARDDLMSASMQGYFTAVQKDPHVAPVLADMAAALAALRGK
ncbi:MAG: glutathione S-transferase family protein [Gammaproteobacteria bacterium]|nr:glutathione S-transferase family protein [Gammaproteobacteria bacterium]